MKTCRILILAAVVCHDLCTAVAVAIREGEAARGVNPIRKVVNLLEGMLKKVEAEGEEEQKLHEAAMCACKKGIADLENTIAANTEKAPGLASQIKVSTSSLAKLKEDLKNHKADVAAAASALEDARGSRAREVKAFEAESSEKKKYIASLEKALPAMRKGMNSAMFLQTESALAPSLRSAAARDSALTDGDRDTIISFLSADLSADQDSEVEGSGEIVGILSSMLDDYKSDLAAMTKTERAAASTFEELENAKMGEISSLRTTIQKKTERAGNLAVDLVQKHANQKQSDKMIAADQEMLDNLNAECSAKGPAHEKRTTMRNDEIKAIHDTVDMLSSGDALDTFKSSLPGSSAAFIQLGTGGARAAAAVLRQRPHIRPELRFLELALMGKKVDFTKVTKLIDDMIALTGREQDSDDKKKKSCRAQLQKSVSKAADLGRKIKEQTATQDDRSEKMEDVVGEIKSAKAEILALDKLVKDAQKERKAENAEFQTSTAGKTSAKEILEVAKKRLDAFYNKPEVFLAAEDAQLDKNPMPTQALLKVFDQRTPSTMFIQTDSRRSGTGNKVIRMLGELIHEMSVEMAVAKHDEEASQESYEKTVGDSSKKRAVYVKNLNSKENIKADYEQLKTKEDNELGASQAASIANKEFDLQLHKECDWLIENFALRRKARTDEADSLARAKAVLSGGDFSLVQVAERHAFLAPRS